MEGADEVEIDDLAYDSRQVRPGTLFICVPTVGGDPRSGGYRFLPQAIAAGAAAVALAAGDPPADLPVVRVPDARVALADLGAAFFNHPSRDLRLFAVTGTDGKTTTAYLLEQTLASAGLCTGLLGTVETKIAGRRFPNAERMTTPESLDIQRLLRRMVDAGVTHLALEASSHALALDRLHACRFAAAALTNVTGDHLEFHGSWDAYVAAKTRLFTELAQGRPAVLNRDDEQYDRFARLTTGPVLSYGLHPGADLRAEVIAEGVRSSACRWHYQGGEAAVQVRLPGRFNVANALAASGLALAAGLDLATVASGISHAHGPPGRLQPVDVDAPFDVLIDYAHTPNAFRSVLSTLRDRLSARASGGGRLIAVFGAAGNRDRWKRPELARIAREYADFFYITNEDPFGEDPRAILDQIAAGIPAGDEGQRYRRILDRGEAIETAIAGARAGDVVVILGKGHEGSIAVGDRKEPWSDLEAVRGALERAR